MKPNNSIHSRFARSAIAALTKGIIFMAALGVAVFLVILLAMSYVPDRPKVAGQATDLLVASGFTNVVIEGFEASFDDNVVIVVKFNAISVSGAPVSGVVAVDDDDRMSIRFDRPE